MAAASRARAPGRLGADSGPRLAAAVDARFGLKLQAGLHSRLVQAGEALLAARTVRDLEDLLTRLADDDTGSPVVRALCEAASVTETYFFRDRGQLQALARAAQTHLLGPLRAAGQRTLRVWSVACATGEEPYTLAHLFQRAAPDFEVTVLATDMNVAALEVARTGVYGKRAFRGSAPEAMEGLVRPRGELLEVLPGVREHVTFLELNLVQDAFPPLRGHARPFDVVVCRNVLIYVDAASLPGVIHKLVQSCAPRSLLALSPAEYPAREHAAGFEDLGHALFWRGGGPKVAAKRAPPARAAVSAEKQRPLPARVRAPVPVPVRPRDTPPAPAATVQQVDALIALTPDSPELYLLRGQLHLGAADPVRALRDFRAALFLKPSFPAAELGSAQALLKEGRAAEAERAFARVLRALESEPADAQVEGLDVTVAWVRKLAQGGS